MDVVLNRVDLTLDCTDAEGLAAFWKTAVGYVDEPPPPPFATRQEWLESFGEAASERLGGAWLHDPTGVAPRLCLLEVPEEKVAKNRLHFDLRVAGSGTPEQRWTRITTEVARLRSAGASTIAIFDGLHVVMADPEGNEFCVC